MKIETPKKPNKEASKWEEHMGKKAKGSAKESGADITHAKKKPSVAPAKGKVHVQEPAKQSAKVEHKQEAKKQTAAAGRAGRTDNTGKVLGKAAKKDSGIAEVAREVSVEEQLEDLDVLKHPLVTEKAVNMIEGENKLTFVVNKGATKPTVKSAVESLYKVRVKKVSILNDMKARKRAIVTLHKEFKASDIATKLGVI